MNQHDTPTTNVATPSRAAGDIPGLARVENIPASSFGSKVPANTLLGDFVGGLLGIVARVLNPKLIDWSLSNAKKIGHYAVLAAGALTVVYSIYGAIKFNSFAVFGIGLGMTAAMAVAQFVAIRFLGAADTIIAATPSRVSSPAFLECAGLLILLFAATMLFTGITTAIAAQTFMPLLPALLFSVTLACFGALALHPQIVNVETGTGTAGEEAIGLLSFFFKSGLKLAPLYFAVFAVVGALTLVVSFFGSGGTLAGMAQQLVNIFPLPVQVPGGLSGSALVLMACLIPIMSYFAFLLAYLSVDLVRAVLSVPAKLDALKR